MRKTLLAGVFATLAFTAVPALAYTAPAPAAQAPAAVHVTPATAQADGKLNYHDRHDRYDRRGRYDRYDRNGRYRNPHRMTRNDRMWRGRDGRYYCRRDNGTTGLVIGAALGGLAGHEIAGNGDRTLGAILGAAGGGLLGRSIDRGDLKCR